MGTTLSFSKTRQKFLFKITLEIVECSIGSCLLIEMVTSLISGAKIMPCLTTRVMVEILDTKPYLVPPILKGAYILKT